jgi:hypothetical protein
MVGHGEIECFLDKAASTLRKPDWAEKTGFVPSIYFLRGANCSEFDDVAFMLSWIALEILTNAYASERGISTILPKDEFNKIVKPSISRALSEMDKENITEKQKVLIEGKVSELNRPSIRNNVYKLRDEYSWDFITNRLFEECNLLRNKIMHSGTYEGFNQYTLIDLSTRFRDSIQLALIDLLGCSNWVPDLQGLRKKIKGD